ncbi:MAG: MFS transporter, partial [Treponema sp.]|nr:MFS transporter [Treponema sp.]
WIVSSYTLSMAIFLLPFGRIGDIIGRKKIYFSGILLFIVSSFLIIFSWNPMMMILLRIMQGFSGAMIFSTSMAIVTPVFEPGERGKAMGITVTSTYLGISLGPVLGGLLTQYLGWRSIFYSIIPFLIAALVLIKLKIKAEWAEASGEKFDWKGSLAYGIGLFCFMYGLSKIPAPLALVSLAAGLLLTALFVFIEIKTASPVFEVGLFLKNRTYAFSSLAALINYAATSAVGFFMSLYLQYLKGFDARIAGLVMISQPLAMTLLSPLAGKLSDKINPGIIASAGMGIISVVLVLFCFINENMSTPYLVALLVMLGAGFGLFSAPNQNAIMSSVEKKHLGTASGVLGTMRTIGQMMSMSIAMLLLSFHVGNEAITVSNYPALIAAIRSGFLVFAVLSAFGIFASLARNKKG